MVTTCDREATVLTPGLLIYIAYVHTNFFGKCVINIWNSLPDVTVNFDSFYKFNESVKHVNF